MIVFYSLLVDGVMFVYGDCIVIDGFDLQIVLGKIMIIVGVNGCGKLMLLCLFVWLLLLIVGQIVFDGRLVYMWFIKEVVCIFGLFFQFFVVLEGIVVVDFVGCGRYLYQKMLVWWSMYDYEVVVDVFDVIGIIEFVDCSVDEFFGGQWQWVWIVMVFVQEIDILLLDELIMFFDVVYQVEVFDLFIDLSVLCGMIIVMVLYDFNFVVCYVDELVVMKDGCVYVVGVLQDVVIVEFVEEVFGFVNQIIIDLVFGKLMVIFIGRYYVC